MVAACTIYNYGSSDDANELLEYFGSREDFDAYRNLLLHSRIVATPTSEDVWQHNNADYPIFSEV